MDKDFKPDLLDKLSNNYFYTDISFINFIFNVVVVILLSYLVSYTYRKFGRSFSNRREFSKIFPLLSLSTFFIITIIKSSLALSLGLVGALSIVRFRSAIKEPEELIYLFISIAIGLGLGANQTLISISIILIIFLYVFARSKINREEKSKFFNLLITFQKSDKVNFEQITKFLSKYSDNLNLSRYSENDQKTQIYFQLNISSFNEFKSLQKDLFDKFEGIEFDFMDNNE